MNTPLDDTVSSSAILGDRIREARRRQNMTQGQLAGTDYSVSYISAIERNKIRPSLRALSWLARSLNVNLSDLLASDNPVFAEIVPDASVAEDEVQTAITQAQMALASRDFERVRQLLVAVRDGVKVPSQRIQVNLLLGEAYVGLHLGNEAKEVLEQNLALTRDIDPVAQEQSRNILGTAYNLLQMHMMAAECHRQCFTAIESQIIRDPSFELSVLSNLGNDYMSLGLYDEAIKTFSRASDRGQQLLTPFTLADLYWRISDEYRREGLLPQATRYADMAAEHLRIAANRQVFAHIQSSLGLAYAELNDNDHARSTLEQARDLSERAGDSEGSSIALASLSRVLLASGDVKGARAAAEQAIAKAEVSQAREAMGRAYLALGEALSKSKESAKADENFSKGLKLLEEAGAQAELTRAYEHYADLLEQSGDVKRALDYLRKARAVPLGNSR